MAKEENEFFVEPGDPPSKRAILGAAFRLFVRDGYDATNIREIGKEAGYSNPALFKFFESKEDLGLYLFERCYLKLAESFASTVGHGHSFEDSVNTTLDRFCSVLDETPGALLFVQDHLRHFWPKVSTEVRRRSILVSISQMVERGVAERVIDPNVDPKMLVAAFVGFLTQYARMHYFGEFKGGITVWKSQLRVVSRRLLVG